MALTLIALNLLLNIRNARYKAYFEEGNKLFKSRNFSEALVFYKNALKRNKVDFVTYGNIIKIYVWQRNLDEALNMCDSYAEIFPEKCVPYYFKGAVYQEKGDIEKALECYSLAIDIEPDSKNVYLAKANVLFLLHRYEETIVQLDLAVKLGCKEEDICIKKGQALLNIHKYNEAEEYYKSIMELCPGEYKLNGELACAKFYQGKYKASKEHYDRNLEEYSNEKDQKPFENPLIPENLNSIIEFLNQNNIEHSEIINNDLDNTEKRNNILRSTALKITTAVDNEDNDDEILKWAVDKWVEILSFYICSKQLESIILEKSPALSLVEDEHTPIPETGEAVKDEAAVLNKVNSKVYKAYLLTGFYLILILLMVFSAYRSYKNSQNAENPFSPNYAGNFGESVKYLGIGENLLAQSQYNAAIEAFDKSIKLYSDNARVHVGKAAALIGLKEYDKAVDECDTALRMNKDYEEALIYKGDALALLKRYSEAITAYTKAIEVNPNNVGAANKIEKCKKMINN